MGFATITSNPKFYPLVLTTSIVYWKHVLETKNFFRFWLWCEYERASASDAEVPSSSNDAFENESPVNSHIIV